MGTKGGRNDDAHSGEETFTYSEDPVGLRASERAVFPSGPFSQGFFFQPVGRPKGLKNRSPVNRM